MRISLQDAAWLILTDEQGRRQGYTEAMEYFDEIPVAYKPIERTGLPRRGPPNQEYQFTEDVPVTATILGRDMGTYQYFQTVDRHWFNLEKVPTGKGIKDTIRFDSQGNRFSIHFDPVARDRTGSFAFTDRMNSRRNMENKVTFYGKELPVLTGATLIFTSDIDALLTGKPGMTVALDTDSDGQPERSVVVASGAQNPNGSRAAEFSPQIPEFTELFGTETTSQAKE